MYNSRLTRLVALIQNPPLYLHITSTRKEGLEQAVEKIQELIKQDLPQLVDDRRLRRRDQDTVERDEFGRVGNSAAISKADFADNIDSASGGSRKCLLISNPFQDSTYGPR